SLLVLPFAARERDLDLRHPVREVDAERDQGQALLVHLTSDLIDLAPMQEQLARAKRQVRALVPLLVRGDVQTLQPHLVPSHATETVHERSVSSAERLHLVPRELDPALETLEQLVVMSRATVAGDDLLALVLAAHRPEATRRGSGGCRSYRRRSRRPRRRSRSRA